MAQEFGQIPYLTVDQNIERAAGVDPSKIAARLLLTSRTGVKPADVTLTIQSKAAPIKLTISPDGGIGDFPRTDALRKENPQVVTNQPKGSIDLNVEIGVPIPSELTFPYQLLVDGARALNRPLKGQLENPSPTKLKFLFDDPKATISAPGKGGTVTVKADAKGEAILEVDPALGKDGAKVTFSTKARWICLAK